MVTAARLNAQLAVAYLKQNDIAVAREKIEKALDKVRGFFMRRAFSGDFVSHNGKTVNVSGPGAERILSSLGLMGVGWSLTD